MDGTLVDTETLWWEGMAEVAAELGYALTPADEVHVVGTSVEAAASFVIDATGSNLPAGTVAERLTHAFCERVERGVTFQPGAVRLLDHLAAHGLPIGLVSASPRRVVNTVLRTLGAARFRLTVAAEDSPRNKPHPDPYLTALAGLGLEAGSCVAVEDSPTGVASAESAGCAVLAVPSSLPVSSGPGRLVKDSLEHVDLALLQGLVRRAGPTGI